MRRRELILPSGSGPTPSGPLYPLDGTYTTTNPSGTLVISNNSHWHYKKTQNGTLKYQVFAYPSSQFLNQSLTYRAEVSNITVITGSVSNKKIRLGNDGSAQIIDLCNLGDGDGTYSQVYEFTYSYQNLIRLYLTESWSTAWEVEFDFKLYADDVWIS